MEKDRQNCEIEYCSRCKMKEAEVQCNSCSPFYFFCQSCDEYVHSMSSKKTHERNLLDKNVSRKIGLVNVDNSIQINEINKNEKNTNFSNNHNYNSTQFSDFRTQSEFDYSKTVNTADRNSISNFRSRTQTLQSKDNLSNLNNLNSTMSHRHASSQGENYINEIKRMYDTEKEELITKIHILGKQSETIEFALKDQIRGLSSQLDEANKQHNMAIKLIQDDHALQIRKIINDKDGEIKFLSNKISEIEKSNEELLNKLNEYYNQIQNSRIEYNDNIGRLEYELQRRDHEINETRNYCEKRIQFANETFSEEKAKLIENYEKSIDRLNFGYKESKEKFLNLINHQEDEYRDLIKRSKIEEDKMLTSIDSLKQENGKLKNEISELNMSLNQLKIENSTLNEDLGKSKKETKFYFTEYNKSEEKLKGTLQEKEETKQKLEKLNMITHGKFNKKK